MFTRTTLLMIAAVVVGFLIIGGSVIALTLAHGSLPSNSYSNGMMNRQQNYGNTMDGQYNGSSTMMNGQYNGGTMMGSSQQGATVTDITHMMMQDDAFQYANIQVRAGTTVTWTNMDNVPHSVTFKNGMKDSGLLSEGQSFRYTFNTPGTYQYYCTVHPSMVATVTVTQ